MRIVRENAFSLNINIFDSHDWTRSVRNHHDHLTMKNMHGKASKGINLSVRIKVCVSISCKRPAECECGCVRVARVIWICV